MNKIVLFVVVIILGVFAILFGSTIAEKKATQQTTTSPTPAITFEPTKSASDSAQASTSASITPKYQPVSATSATIKTAKGNIVIAFYPQDAPKTVTNFATLAKNGYYNGLTFHRVEPGFVIQGGDPIGNGTGGESIYGAKFEDELNPQAPSYQTGYKEGVVAMANSGPNTNGSQFFIMLEDNESLPKNYTIFGKVTSGIDVVKKIQVGDKMTNVSVE